MNADAFRHLYDYHFSENRRLLDLADQLSADDFNRPVHYSHGPLRDQLIHLASVDEAWFSGLGGVQPPEAQDPQRYNDRRLLRAYFERVEQFVRAYLDGLRDEQLFERPFPEGEDHDLYLWQVLVHVVNHATDHRAQALRLLNDLGIQSGPQDYIFYAYEHPFKGRGG
jgi:uncharacterized damage-inducible protein DinB